MIGLCSRRDVLVAMVVLLGWGVGCGVGKPIELPDDTSTGGVDSGDSGGGESGAGDSDSGGNGGESGPPDQDGDGSDLTDDCNDADPNVYPGAAEVWNGEDDDCDGVVDADGAYTGTIRVSASAVYYGENHRYSFDCPGTLDRLDPAMSFVATCTPDPTDELAQLLLGATFTITGADTRASGAAWSGVGVVTSANGWDSNGTAALTWSDLSSVALTTDLSAASLRISGAGTLRRTP